MTVAVFFSLMSAMAQDEPQGKLNVFFDYFERPNNIPFVWAEAVRNNVMEGIQKTNRVNLIDVDSKSALAIEKSRREQDNVVAGEDLERLRVMQEEGANLLVKGIITDITAAPSRDKDGKLLGYDAAVAFTLKVIDPANGTTIHTENYKFPQNIFKSLLNTVTTSTAASEDEAVQNIAKSVPGGMKKFVDKAFPLEGKIIDLDDAKGNEVKTAYINLGSENGIAKGAKFEVRVKRMIGGKTSYKYLGEAEVADVESEDLAKIKIKKGGKDIYQAYQANQEVVIRTAK